MSEKHNVESADFHYWQSLIDIIKGGNDLNKQQIAKILEVDSAVISRFYSHKGELTENVKLRLMKLTKTDISEEFLERILPKRSQKKLNSYRNLGLSTTTPRKRLVIPAGKNRSFWLKALNSLKEKLDLDEDYQVSSILCIHPTELSKFKNSDHELSSSAKYALLDKLGYLITRNSMFYVLPTKLREKLIKFDNERAKKKIK